MVAGSQDDTQTSITTSPCGREQQIRTLPCAGISSGSGEYATPPDTSPLSQLWHTPLRHDHRTGTSHASASSSRLWWLARQCVAYSSGDATAAATSPNDQVLVLRALSPVVEPAMLLLRQVWAAWRAELWAIAGTPPRIWAL